MLDISKVERLRTSLLRCQDSARTITLITQRWLRYLVLHCWDESIPTVELYSRNPSVRTILRYSFTTVLPLILLHLKTQYMYLVLVLRYQRYYLSTPTVRIAGQEHVRAYSTGVRSTCYWILDLHGTGVPDTSIDSGLGPRA